MSTKMTNEQLQKILQRFPATCEIEVQSGANVQPIDHAEYVTLQAPQTVGDSAVAWADLVRDSIRVRLVTPLVHYPPISAKDGHV